MHDAVEQCRRGPRGSRAFFVLSAALLAVGLSGGRAWSQVPTLPPPPDATVPPAPPPTGEGPTPVPDPAKPPAPPTTGVPSGPGAPIPPTPGKSAPTTIPVPSPEAPDPTPGSRPATFTSSAAGLDLSEIDALRRQARGRGPRTPEPDAGFEAALPYGPEAGAASDSAAGEATELGLKDSRAAEVRSLGSVAGGLAALVLLGLAVSILRQARRGLVGSPTL